MSEIRTETGLTPTSQSEVAGSAGGTTNGSEPHALAARIKVVVHRLDGGIEEGESDARTFAGDGYRFFSAADPDHVRQIPVSDIKYVVFGSAEDAGLEADPGDSSEARKGVLRI